MEPIRECSLGSTTSVRLTPSAPGGHCSASTVPISKTRMAHAAMVLRMIPFNPRLGRPGSMFVCNTTGPMPIVLIGDDADLCDMGGARAFTTGFRASVGMSCVLVSIMRCGLKDGGPAKIGSATTTENLGGVTMTGELDITVPITERVYS